MIGENSDLDIREFNLIRIAGRLQIVLNRAVSNFNQNITNMNTRRVG